jgi:hypothetical protein
MAHEANAEEHARAPRSPIPTWYFALVVVRRGHRFLLTQDEIRARPLRGAELRVLLETVAGGCQVFPLDLLGGEMSV